MVQRISAATQFTAFLLDILGLFGVTMIFFGRGSEEARLVVECLERVVIGRRKKLTFQRTLAFVKRMCCIALQAEHHAALALLALVRQLLQLKSQVDVLLDTDSSVGQGLFLPELSDPEYCNAASSALFELTALQKHYHPLVRQMASNIIHGAPSSGESSLPPDISKLSHRDLLSDYDPSQVAFKPAIPTPKSNVNPRIKSDNIQQPELAALANTALQVKSQVDFSCLFDQKPVKVEDIIV